MTKFLFLKISLLVSKPLSKSAGQYCEDHRGKALPRVPETPRDVPESTLEVKYYWKLLRCVQTVGQGIILLFHVSPAGVPTLIQTDCELVEGKLKDWGLPSVPPVKGQSTST